MEEQQWQILRLFRAENRTVGLNSGAIFMPGLPLRAKKGRLGSEMYANLVKPRLTGLGRGHTPSQRSGRPVRAVGGCSSVG